MRRAWVDRWRPPAQGRAGGNVAYVEFFSPALPPHLARGVAVRHGSGRARDAPLCRHERHAPCNAWELEHVPALPPHLRQKCEAGGVSQEGLKVTEMKTTNENIDTGRRIVRAVAYACVSESERVI